MDGSGAGQRRVGVGLAGGALVAGLVASARGRTRRLQRRLARLDADADAREIVWQLGVREFPWDIETALSFALFRTYAVPSISVLLEATGAFVHDARKRYDDTELVLAEVQKHGLDHPRGRTALRRMNAMHAAYDIDPDDTLYVLTTFILEPMRWLDRFGWRAMTDHERDAWLRWQLQVARHMGLRDLPEDLDWFDRFNRDYEAEHFRFHPANRAVADASVELFLGMSLPRPLHGLGEVAVRALLDPPLLAAFGYEPAPPAVVRTVEGALRARATVQRRLLPERRTDHDLTTVRRPTYPHGHDVATLGTFPTSAERAHANAALASLRAARPSD